MQKFRIFPEESTERNENILELDGRVGGENGNIKHNRVHQL